MLASVRGVNTADVPGEVSHVRCRDAVAGFRLVCPPACLHTPVRKALKQMPFDLILGGAVALFLLVYLIYALVRPEHF